MSDDDHRRTWKALRLLYAANRLREIAGEIEVVGEGVEDLVDVGPEDEITTFIPECAERLRDIGRKMGDYAESVRP